METSGKILQIRKDLKMTQVEFAKALKVCGTSVQHWENERRKPGFKSCFKIVILAKKFKLDYVTLDWIRSD